MRKNQVGFISVLLWSLLNFSALADSYPGPKAGAWSTESTVTVTPTATATPTTFRVPEDFSTIQSAIDAASDSVVILVAPGTYSGPGNRDITYLGKSISVISERGPAETVINCGGSLSETHRGFYFHSGEDAGAVLDGFTIRNGYILTSGADAGGGICCDAAGPTIMNCYIVNNTVQGRDTRGGGIACINGASPRIFNCLIGDNSSYCDEPDSSARGGGVYSDGYLDISACRIYNNGAEAWWNASHHTHSIGQGGGIFCAYQAQIADCLITGNFVTGDTEPPGNGSGGGLYVQNSASAVYTTLAGNTAQDDGSGLYCAGDFLMENSILWDDYYAPPGSELRILYSDVRGGYDGTGNIQSDPLFTTGPLGTYYLSQTDAGQGSDSPCIDTGDSESTVACFQSPVGYVCLDQLFTRTDHVPDNGIVNMGFHYLPETFTPGTATPTPDPSGILHVPADYATIQAAIDAASKGQTVMISDGFYTGKNNTNLDFNGKPITVCSENGPAFCIIDCENKARGFIFHSDEAASSVVRGLTITAGNSDQGGAIYCETADPSILDCRFYLNSGDSGAAIYCLNSNPLIRGCLFNWNQATDEGGGVFCNNSAPFIADCTFTDNAARHGGAMFCTWFSSPEIWNCLFSHNSAMEQGGAAACNYLSFPRLENCTLARNSASTGAGIFSAYSSPYVLNSIVWNNVPDGIFYESASAPLIEYSDVQETMDGPGNLNEDPYFTFGPLGEYYLAQPDAGQDQTSPCVDSGSVPAAEVCFGPEDDLVCLSDLTTRTNLEPDSDLVDMGFHFPVAPDSAVFGCRVVMPGHTFSPGDPCFCDVQVYNPGKELMELPLFVILDVFGSYYFAPSFSDFDYLKAELEPGMNTIHIIPGFEWPQDAGEASGILWYAALTDQDISKILGNLSTFEFGWTAEKAY